MSPTHFPTAVKAILDETRVLVSPEAHEAFERAYRAILSARDSEPMKYVDFERGLAEDRFLSNLEMDLSTNPDPKRYAWLVHAATRDNPIVRRLLKIAVLRYPRVADLFAEVSAC